MIRYEDFGHDGSCDHEENGAYTCRHRAVAAVLSATLPTPQVIWEGAPAASVAFLCDEHLAAEPIASREHAEFNAHALRGIAGRAILDGWDALLASYPSPIPLGA